MRGMSKFEHSRPRLVYEDLPCFVRIKKTMSVKVLFGWLVTSAHNATKRIN